MEDLDWKELLKESRGARYMLLLLAGAVTFFLFLGGMIWWQEYQAGSESGMWLAALFFVGTFSAVGWFCCKPQWHLMPQPFFDATTRALVIPQSPWTGASRIAGCLPWGLYLAAGTWREPYLGVFTVPVILYLLGPALLRLTRRWRPGGLWLSPEMVSYRSPGAERSLEWAQISSAEHSHRHFLMPLDIGFERDSVPGLAFRAKENNTVTERKLWLLWRERPRRRNEIFVRTETLGVSLYVVEHLSTTLVRWPKARIYLSSPQILHALENLEEWRQQFRR